MLPNLVFTGEYSFFGTKRAVTQEFSQVLAPLPDFFVHVMQDLQLLLHVFKLERH